MSTVQVRYIVNDVDSAIAFYTDTSWLPRGHAPSSGFRHAVPRRPAARAERTQRPEYGRGVGSVRRTQTDSRGAGIASPFRLTTSPTCQRSYAKQVFSSAATSSRASPWAPSHHRAVPTYPPGAPSAERCTDRNPANQPETRLQHVNPRELCPAKDTITIGRVSRVVERQRWEGLWEHLDHYRCCGGPLAVPFG